MNRLKKIVVAVLCIVLSIQLFSMKFSEGFAEENDFCGTRNIEFYVDKSDLNNYIDGGRAVFDLILREKAPKWLNYSISSEDRDLILKLRFKFFSYDEYCEKVSELITYSPAVFYSIRGEFLLIESYSAEELLNCFQAILSSKQCLREKGLEDLFHVRSNEITVKSVTYQLSDRAAVYTEEEEPVKFDSINVDTTANADGTFVRRITVCIDSELKERVLSRFESIGQCTEEQTSDNKIEISVIYDGNNQNELLTKTMYCLRVPTSISEKQQFLSEKMVSVERNEFFDFKKLLNEKGEFYYSHEFPTYVNNITENNHEIHISGIQISSKNEEDIVCKYEREVQFSEIEILTNLNNLSGKMERIISFVLPLEIGANYHDLIKQKIQTRLVRGSVFNIYDEGGRRIYEISFSSFLVNELAEFSKSVLHTQRSMKYSNSWIPFGKSELVERVDDAEILSKEVPPEKIEFRYHLPSISKVLSKQSRNVRIEKSSMICEAKYTDNINLEFRCLNVLKLLIELLIIFIVIVVIIRIKKKKMKIYGGKK